MVLSLIKSALGSGKDAGRDRRSMPRLEEARATLVLDGASYPLVDWNPKGFQIAPYKGKLTIGKAVRVRMIIPHKGKSFGFDLNGKVKRLDPHNRGLGGVFTDVEKSTAQKLSRLYDERFK